MKSFIEVTEFDKVIEYIGENALTELGHKLVINAKIYDDI